MDPLLHDADIPVAQRLSVIRQMRAVTHLAGYMPPSNKAVSLAEGKWVRGEIDNDGWKQELDAFVAWVWGTLR